ncbi:hypothetical protein EJ04DRAFT_480028 [Polyplosphaeria fusca]|uniref:Uncharacterized protein n=1 Tax=Polyplosphaeria fusca TaxID=682080 RepID=A0A9P4QL74_9PLEO|nr:hypothetical protein EJ04DRAFT_480028 [Polyplosphaeria fusca]
MAKPFPFLKLPSELRDQIYSHYLEPILDLGPCEFGGGYPGGTYSYNLDLLRVCQQIYSEANDVWRREHLFVRIDTPWEQAVNHISHEGLVPIVAMGNNAKLFQRYHSLVKINAPEHFLTHLSHAIIIRLEDLHRFAQMWYYSALNYEALNQHLRVTLALTNPSSDGKEISKDMQKDLLLPFGNIKSLDSVAVHGFDSALEKELRRLMAIPYDSPQKCCEDATALMESGDRAIIDGDAADALDRYIKAFHAIHILINGRERRILADHFFHHEMNGGRYQGQSGTTVRIILRIKLVARCVNAYLKLKEYSEAAFWGMRSIRIMRDTIGADFEDFLIQVAGMLDAGILYVRTGVAIRNLEHAQSSELDTYAEDGGFAKSECLFRIAGKFLKGDNRNLIKKELEDNNIKMPEEFFFDGDEGTGSDIDSLAHMEHMAAEAEMAEQNVAQVHMTMPSQTIEGDGSHMQNYLHTDL